MLSPHDAQLVRGDCDVVGLGILLDNEALTNYAAEFLSLPDVVEARCEYVRYKPGQNCLARFRVFDSHGEENDFYAIAYRAVDAAKLRKTRQATVIPASSIVICRFPVDLELQSLARLSTDAGLRHLLERMGCTEMVAGPLLQSRLRYKPERRYVARIETAVGAATLKIYAPDIFPAAYNAAKSLSSSVDLPIARRLARSRRHRAILFNWQEGVALSSRLTRGALRTGVIGRVGQQLARLHSVHNVKLRRFSLQEDADSLIAVTENLGRLIPRLAEQVQRLARRIAERVANVRSPRWALIHGDFSAEQIVVENNQPCFIDLDRASCSVSAKDIGNFIGHLELDTVYEKYSEQIRDQVAAALIEGYLEAGATIDRAEIELHTVASLLRLAQEPFRNRFSDWHEHIACIVRRAQEISNRLSEPTTHRMRSAILQRQSVEDGIIDVQGDTEMPFLNHATTIRLAQDRLSDVFRSDRELRFFKLCSVRTLRYKKGRRCLIEYHGWLADSGCEATVLGKVHAKNRHEQALLRQQMLWNAGFDSDSPDGICVARPLGNIPEWHMWLQCAVPGQVCWSSLLGPRAESIAKRIAEAIHKLHQADIPAQQTHTLNDELAVLSDRLLQVGAELPQFGERIQRILYWCQEMAGTIVPVSPAGIHRDFYPDQVLIDGERVFVVDHDLYALGDPRLDVGNFCGHLIEHSVRNERHPNAYDRATLAMIDRFVKLYGNEQPSRSAIDIYTVLTVARHVSLSRQIVQRHLTTLPLIELLEKLIGVVPSADRRTTCIRI
jgi:aminoglycoside phosphotransferase (APT) family kinase protein